MGSHWLRDLYPSPQRVLSDARLSESAVIASGLKSKCLLNAKNRFVQPVYVHAMLLSINYWNSVRNWLGNWDADLVSPFHLFNLHPEWFDPMMIYLLSYGVLLFFHCRLLFSTQVWYTPPQGYFICGQSERTVGGIVLYTHIHTLHFPLLP